ncbi:MarR family transcriptional regulator [Rhodanobacter aciditrophus]|uniref:MarR family transcriptional regulator n=1 Tax=Rhodanobacter aciditrophus TaxID=1623218 RepID=A0ABW4B3F7_9GAMM
MENSLGWNLSRAALSWRHAVDTYMADLGLTQSKWIAMLHLNRKGEGLTQSELAADIGIEQPSLIRTLNNLQAAGLIERRESPKDARCKTLWFTEEGHRKLNQMEQIASQGREELLKGLSPEQREQLSHALLIIIDNAHLLINKD